MQWKTLEPDGKEYYNALGALGRAMWEQGERSFGPPRKRLRTATPMLPRLSDGDHADDQLALEDDGIDDDGGGVCPAVDVVAKVEAANAERFLCSCKSILRVERQNAREASVREKAVAKELQAFSRVDGRADETASSWKLMSPERTSTGEDGFFEAPFILSGKC